MDSEQSKIEEHLDIVEPPEAPVRVKGVKRNSDCVIVAIDEESNPSPPKRHKEKENKVHNFSLLEIKIDRVIVDNFVHDADSYDLMNFKYSHAYDKWEGDLGTIDVWLIAYPKDESAARYDIHVSTTFKEEPGEDSFTQMKDFLHACKIPIPCGDRTELSSFFWKLCKFRPFPGCSPIIWRMEDFELDVPNEWEGEEMAYYATFNFVLRKCEYDPAPKVTETLVFIDPGQFKKAIQLSQ